MGYISAIIFGFFTIMTLYSHIMCMITNPGVIPKKYSQLNDHNLPLTFNKLLNERESMYQAA
jgi:hypothetical protein